MLTRIIDLLAGIYKGRLKTALKTSTAEALTEVHAEFAAALEAGDLEAVAAAAPLAAVGDRPRGRKVKA